MGKLKRLSAKQVCKILTFDELWELLITQDESVQIEAKKASDIGKSIWETISAFSNEPDLGGGYLLLGIKSSEDSDNKIYEIEGLADPDKIQRDLATQCRESFNIPIRPQIETTTKERKKVIIAFISEVQPSEKPVYIAKRGLPKGAFRRIGSTDQKCTDRDIELFYQERKSLSYDITPITEATLDNLDPNAIRAYRQAKAKLKPNAPELDYSDQDLLYSLNVISKQNGNYCPTIAGLLLFGNVIALRRYCPLHRVDYILIEGTEWISDYQDRYQTIEIREPLLLGIPRLVTTVLNDLPTRFGLAEDSVQRQEIPLIPRKVIREAIVNAVMHRDYRKRSPIQIIKYSDRLEIRNCGYSLKTLNQETLGEPGSVIRNEAIASVLHETGFAETKGSGIRVMIETMLEANLSLPTFESNRYQDQFQVIIYSHNLFDEDALQWLSQFKEYNLTDEEAKILVVLREKRTINNAICRLVNDVDTLKASQKLKHLRDLGIIETHGKSTATFYTLKSEFLSGQSEPPNLDSSTKAQDSLSGQLEIPNLDSSTKAKNLSTEYNSTDKSLSTEYNSTDKSLSTEYNSTDKETYLEEMPEPLKQDVLRLGKRAERGAVRDLIITLCQWRELSSRELSIILERDQGYLLNQYLNPLITSGSLVYTLPETPTDPCQAYRANQVQQQ